MIREFKIKDLERVMESWLESNIDAHSFIDKKYWEARGTAFRQRQKVMRS